MVPAKNFAKLMGTLEIPTNLPHSTAIGFGIAYYYTLEVSNELESSFLSTKIGPRVSQHIYIKALNPVVENRTREEVLPPDWAPLVSSKRVFSEPALANFATNPKIEWQNRVGLRNF